MYTFETPPRYQDKASSNEIGELLQTLKPCLVPLRPLLRFGKFFCEVTSIHGFRHIAEPGRHWFERFLWILATSLAIWGAVDISLGQLQRFNENPTVVTLEKDYRTWNFSIPAVTACLTNRVNPKKIEDAIFKRWGVSPGDKKYEYYHRFVKTVANSDLRNLTGYREFDGDTELDVQLTDLVIAVKPEENIKISSSVGSDPKVMKFVPVMTELGICHTINSLAILDIALKGTDLNFTKSYPMKCAYGSSSCELIFETEVETLYYSHSPYDIADINTMPQLVPRLELVESTLSVLETVSGKGVETLSPARRRCLYIEETTRKGSQVYSTNTCRQTCRSNKAVELCGCRPFYYPNDEGPICTVSGMACLSNYAKKLFNLEDSGTECVCPSQCVYATFRGTSLHSEKWVGTSTIIILSRMKFNIDSPRVRYIREIVFHFQDLIVSFGGAAGFFLGASFISFVEIVYFLIVWLLKTISAEPQKSNTKHEKTVLFEAMRVEQLTRILEEDQRYLKLNNYV